MVLNLFGSLIPNCSDVCLSASSFISYLHNLTILLFTASLTTLFKHVETVDEQLTDENLRERTLSFIKDKVG